MHGPRAVHRPYMPQVGDCLQYPPPLSLTSRLKHVGIMSRARRGVSRNCRGVARLAAACRLSRRVASWGLGEHVAAYVAACRQCTVNMSVSCRGVSRRVSGVLSHRHGSQSTALLANGWGITVRRHSKRCEFKKTGVRIEKCDLCRRRRGGALWTLCGLWN